MDERQRAQELCARILARGDTPPGWLEELDAEAARGRATVPWDEGRPWPAFEAWAVREARLVAGCRTLVVGCGAGHDVRLLMRHGGDGVHWRAAGLLDPLDDWAADPEDAPAAQTFGG